MKRINNCAHSIQNRHNFLLEMSFQDVLFIRVMKINCPSINICSVCNILNSNVIKTFFGHQFNYSIFLKLPGFGLFFYSPIFPMILNKFSLCVE
ncbi:D-alanyl-D-alanine carboxypeptidase [Bacillus subtilis subsp. subtilis str. RO-NN-1]|nr:D-alanyl-D-alanine carboxypeptidase [Bacillus subtilis subsp. subtilis str. RO-NN-1]